MAVPTYIGKVQVGDDQIPIGTTMFGTCNTLAATPAKEVSLPGYDNPSGGLLIYVRFDYGNNVDSNMYMEVNGGTGASTSSILVVGNAVCAAGDIVAFVYESGSNNDSHWKVVYGSLRNKVEGLESSLSGLTGAMHFRGTTNVFPPTGTYAAGDVIIGPDTKEYVYNGTTWIELGSEGSYMLKSAYDDTTDITYSTLAANSVSRNPDLKIGTAIDGINSSGSIVTGLADIASGDENPTVVVTEATSSNFTVPEGTTFSISGGVLTLTHVASSTINAVSSVSSKKIVTTPVYFDPGTHHTFTTTTVNDVVTKVQQQNSGA